VLNARSVRVDPPLEGVSPALSRCLEVGPERNTRYTLTAVGADGQTATESLALAVRPDDETLPRITSFQVAGRQLDYRGRTVFLVEFTVQNAEEVSIDPPAFPTLHRAPNGRFYISPERTTTYTLTATGVRGHLARRQLKLEVPE